MSLWPLPNDPALFFENNNFNDGFFVLNPGIWTLLPVFALSEEDNDSAGEAGSDEPDDPCELRCPNADDRLGNDSPGVERLFGLTGICGRFFSELNVVIATTTFGDAGSGLLTVTLLICPSSFSTPISSPTGAGSTTWIRGPCPTKKGCSGTTASPPPPPALPLPDKSLTVSNASSGKYAADD
jgi:hypothetical protein